MNNNSFNRIFFLSIIISAENQDPEILKIKIIENNRKTDHDTALAVACATGHENDVERLVLDGANIEYDMKGYTPLIFAAMAGHGKIAKILLDHGANIEAQSDDKDTALSLAVLVNMKSWKFY